MLFSAVCVYVYHPTHAPFETHAYTRTPFSIRSYWMLIFKACNPILAGVSPSPPRPLIQAARLFTGPLGSLGLDDVANKVKRIYETRMRDHTEEL